MSENSFEIEETPEYTLWAELLDDTVRFHRKEKDTDDAMVALELSRDTLRNVLVWADQGQGVTASLTGPMAEQIKRYARELGLTDELFVWHAVKVFIEVGTS